MSIYYIRTASLSPEMLTYLGYRDIVREEEGRYAVSRLGVPHPEIVRETDMRKQQGEALKDLRKMTGMEKESLARRLMADVPFVEKLENGSAELSDTEFMLAANLYQARKDALSRGAIEKQTLDMEKELERCRILLSRMKEILFEQIEKAEAYTGNRRFFVKPAEDIDVYLIFDASAMDFVKGAGGKTIAFKEVREALEAAGNLEHMQSEITGKTAAAEIVTDRGSEMRKEKESLLYMEDDGLLYIFTADRTSDDGSDVLVAVADRTGDITWMDEIPEWEERRIRTKVEQSFMNHAEKKPDAKAAVIKK